VAAAGGGGGGGGGGGDASLAAIPGVNCARRAYERVAAQAVMSQTVAYRVEREGQKERSESGSERGSGEEREQRGQEAARERETSREGNAFVRMELSQARGKGACGTQTGGVVFSHRPIARAAAARGVGTVHGTVHHLLYGEKKLERNTAGGSVCVRLRKGGKYRYW